jgi:hypothetical protein
MCHFEISQKKILEGGKTVTGLPLTFLNHAQIQIVYDCINKDLQQKTQIEIVI